MDSIAFHRRIESLLDSGQFEAARTSCAEALAFARAAGDLAGEAQAEFASATCAYHAHLFGDAMLIATRAIEIFGELGSAGDEAQARALVSRVLQISGDLAESLQEALLAETLAAHSGEPKAQYAASMALVNVQLALAQWPPAIVNGERAAELARLLADDLRHGRALDTLGVLWGEMAVEARNDGDEPRARQCAGESVTLSQRAGEIARRCGNRRLEATSLANAAESVAFLGRLDEARDMLAAWPLNPHLDSAVTLAHHLGTWGDISMRLGQHDAAIGLFQRALALAVNKPVAMSINAHLAEAFEQVGDLAAAIGHLKRSHTLYIEASSEKAQRIAGVAAVKLQTAAALARADELSRSNEQLKRRAQDLARLSLEDPLTALPNRRALESVLAQSEQAWAVALIDVDNFKQVNDAHSHLVGDEVLRQIANLLRACCRGSDVPVRWGGEEFVILLRQLVDGAAVAAAERVRSMIEGHDWSRVAGGLRVTVSIGVAMGGGTRTLQEVLAEADGHLYVAKHAGRNQVFAGPPTETPP